jgi:hypothetical protein
VKKLKQLAAQQQQLAAVRDAATSQAQQQAAAQPQAAPAGKQVKKKVAAAAKQAPGAQQNVQPQPVAYTPATRASETAQSVVKQVRKRLGVLRQAGAQQQQQQQLVPHLPLFTGGLVPRDGSGWGLLLGSGLALVAAGRALMGALLQPSKAQRWVLQAMSAPRAVS